MRYQPLCERARGRWPGILAALGISSSALTGKHSPCPMCGGKDRFRFDNRQGRGTWICSRCGAGDGVSLAMRYRGCDFKGALGIIEPHIGASPVARPRPEMSDTQKREAMRALWKASHPVRPGDAAYHYLASRVGPGDLPASLRATDRMKYAHGHKVPWYPGLVALIQAANGRPVNLHRTFLTPDGRKAPVDSPRRVMAGSLEAGSAVRLAEYSDTLGIAEGIETALSASQLFNVPVWAALNARLLAKWEPPSGVKNVLVFGDNDKSFTGQKAAYELGSRLSSSVSVAMHIPAREGQDWNDVFRETSASAA